MRDIIFDVLAEIIVFGASSLSLDDAIIEGADVNARAEYGWTPLHLAARFQFSSTLVKRLLAAGADPKAIDKGGDTPLHVAVGYRCKESATLLVRAGADVNARSVDGQTPLHKACEKGGPLSLVKLILLCGADPDQKDAFGDTPAKVAEDQGNLMAADYLFVHKQNLKEGEKYA